jgi:conjugal transfer ATP-binding protein TraC
MAAPKEGLSDYQLSKLQEYVLEAWRDFGNKLDITILAAHISKRAKEEKCRDSQRMADQLFPYTQHGVNGRYFDGDATIAFSKPWSCLELDSLQSKPDLRIIVLIMMVMQLKKDFISDDRNRKKILVIDEFWKFAKVEDGNAPTDPGVLKVIKFIDEAFRVFRKFSASIIISTQSLSDVGKGSPLLNNTEHIILLKQRREAIAYMKEHKMLSISDYDYSMLKTLDKNGSKYSELFIYTTNRGSGFLRFKLDRATALLYTSDGQEEARIRQYEAQGMSILQAIQAYIEDEEADKPLKKVAN